MRSTRAVLGILLLGALAGTGCSEFTEPTVDEVTLQIEVDIPDTTVARMVAEVTGPAITDTITSELTLSNGVGTGSVTVPTGSEVTVTVRAYDANDVETHRGTGTVTPTADGNVTVNVTVDGLDGDQPFEAGLNSYTVTVTPDSATITAGSTQSFAVEVVDADGNTVSSPTVVWAVSNPALAGISDSGLVTALAPGSLIVQATYLDAAGTASLTIE